jgi:uncharacterized protein (DUF983 family)
MMAAMVGTGKTGRPRALVVMTRGLTKRCPRCGQGKLFPRWFTMVERCPRCGLPFERGEGYFLGAMAVNLGVTEAAFGLVLVLGIVFTWPNVPWTWLLVVSLAVNAAVPIVFYPYSKTLFVAFDVMMHRMDPVRSQWHEPDEPGHPGSAGDGSA